MSLERKHLRWSLYAGRGARRIEPDAGERHRLLLSLFDRSFDFAAGFA